MQIAAVTIIATEKAVKVSSFCNFPEFISMIAPKRSSHDARNRVLVDLVRVLGKDRWDISPANYNIGLRYLAERAERSSAMVAIFDPFDADAHDVSISNSLRGDIVGFTIHHLNVDDTLRVIRELKLNRPNAFVIVGGHHAAAAAEDLLRDIPEIDAVCGSGGENTIADLVSAFRTTIGEERDKYRGLLIGPEVNDLNELPFPEPPTSAKVARICTSRGCPYRCTFCTTPAIRRLYKEPAYRARSPENVVAELERLYEAGVRDVRFNDDLFLSKSPGSRARVMRIAELLVEKRLPITYKCEYRCDSIPANDMGRSMLSSLRASGLREVFLGVESGSSTILREYQKDLNFSTSVEAVKMHADAGIVINAGNILASPYSTIQDIVDSIEGFAAMGIAYLFFRRVDFRANVLPGTEMEAELRLQNRLIGTRRYGRLSYTFREQRIEDVVNLLESAMPSFLMRTKGELFTARKDALLAAFDGEADPIAVFQTLKAMNLGAKEFLLRWFRDLEVSKLNSGRFTDEMEVFTSRCCYWGQMLVQLSKDRDRTDLN